MSPRKFAHKKLQKLIEKADIKINGYRPWDIKINDPSVFDDVIMKGSLGFGDAYSAGKWDVEEIDTFFVKLINANIVNVKNLLFIYTIIRDTLINTQAGKRAFQVGHKHYDLGNEMYEYMLGESMGYSCGIYLSEKDDLTRAQYNKFDALCKKMNLRPGMKVLEIGAGWGTLARHAAKHYGVEVIGLTVSKEQKKFAENRCSGLPVKFLLKDYMKLEDKYDNYFDRVVSVEMIEAVGRKNFKTYFSTIERVLKDDGIFALQSIIGDGGVDSFLSTRIFPNGLVPSQQDIVKSIRGKLWIKSWESFGTDYDRTLLDWEANFVKNWRKISKLKDSSGNRLYDKEFYRMWRYYLLLCAATFRVGRNDDAHIIMTKQNSLAGLK